MCKAVYLVCVVRINDLNDIANRGKRFNLLRAERTPKRILAKEKKRQAKQKRKKKTHIKKITTENRKQYTLHNVCNDSTLERHHTHRSERYTHILNIERQTDFTKMYVFVSAKN